MERWVCKRCYASNDEDQPSCTRCGLGRGATPETPWAPNASSASVPGAGYGGETQPQPYAASTPPRRAWWRPLLRFWWIGLLVVGALGGYFTQAHRDDSGAIQTGGTVKIDKLKVGDCYDAPGTGEISEVTGRPCGQTHEFELIAIVQDTQQAAYPDDATFHNFIVSSCVPIFEDWIGIAIDQSALDVASVVPSSDAWRDGDRTVICSVYDPANNKLTSSLKGSRR